MVEQGYIYNRPHLPQLLREQIREQLGVNVGPSQSRSQEPFWLPNALQSVSVHPCQRPG